MTAPTHSGSPKPDASDTAAAIGTISVIVPTDVPIAIDTKQATTKRTITANLAGISDSIKYATLSALLRPTTPTNAPAVRNMSSIVMIFLSASPCAIIPSFSSNVTLWFCKQATNIATRKAIMIGTL